MNTNNPQPSFTPPELDEACNKLTYGQKYNAQSWEAQGLIRRHLAVVRELEQLHARNIELLREQFKKSKPHWHPVSPSDLPKAGEGFSVIEVRDGKINERLMANQFVNGLKDPVDYFKFMTRWTHWTPLPPLPAQKSEAERLVEAFYAQTKIDPSSNSFWIEFAQFALNWRDERGKP